MRIIIICSLLCACASLWSQEDDLQEKTQEELGSGASARSYFCVPGIANKSRSRGVEISYNVSSGGIIQLPNNETQRTLANMQSFEQVNFKLYIPLLLKPDFKLLVGYSYQPERFRYGSLGSEIQPLVTNFQDKALRSNSYSLTASKSLNSRHYIGLRAKVAFNGDYDTWMNFDSRYRTINAMGVFGTKKNEDFEWGVGVYYSQNMRRSLILPFAMLHKNFNDKWGIELAPPAYVYGRYNLDEKSILLFGGEFGSRMYSIDTQKLDAQSKPARYTMNHAEISAMISWERQIVPWVWFNIKGGYQFGIGNRFETDAIPNANLRANPPDAPFFQMSIFLSPPDHMK